METSELKSDASAALAAGDFAKAGALFASYCAAAPTDRQSLLRMGDAWARAGERGRAVDAYLAAAQGFAADGFLARAIAASKLVLELEPGHQRMQRILADLYTQRGVGPGVNRRPRETPPPAKAEPVVQVPVAPPVPTAVAAPVAEEEAPELVVTEFVLDTPSAERTLEDVLAEAVGSHEEQPASQEARPSVPERLAAETGASPLATSVAETHPTKDSPSPVAAGGARFAELSLDETELTLPPQASAAPPKAHTATFSLAEPGRAPPPVVPQAPEPAAVVQTAPEVQAVPQTPAAPAEDGGYIDLSFDEDEPLDTPVPMAPVEAVAVVPATLPDEPLDAGAPEPKETEETPHESAEALARSVPKTPLFSDLSSEAFVELVERCPLRHFAAGERILQQDAPGEAFYVICEGQVVVRREEGSEVFQLARLAEGDFFGEMALLSGAPRVASVDALVDGTLVLEISTALLTELTRRHPGVATALKKFCRQRLVSNLMATAALFRPLSRADRRTLASCFRARDVLAGDVVLTEGERGDGLYLVLAGLLEVSRGGFRIAKLGQSEVFGEASLLGRRPVVATVRALQRTSLLRLPEEDFAKVAERYPAVRAHLEALRDARARENARMPLDPSEEGALLV
jgi:CRP-like cAMP-binding protein